MCVIAEVKLVPLESIVAVESNMAAHNREMQGKVGGRGDEGGCVLKCECDVQVQAMLLLLLQRRLSLRSHTCTHKMLHFFCCLNRLLLPSRCPRRYRVSWLRQPSTSQQQPQSMTHR